MCDVVISSGCAKLKIEFFNGNCTSRRLKNIMKSYDIVESHFMHRGSDKEEKYELLNKIEIRLVCGS